MRKFMSIAVLSSALVCGCGDKEAEACNLHRPFFPVARKVVRKTVQRVVVRPIQRVRNIDLFPLFDRHCH